MNIATIRHIDGLNNKEYLFQIPVPEKIKKGTMVKVRTKLGDRYGILTRDSFEADGEALDAIKSIMGASSRRTLQPILAVMQETPVTKLDDKEAYETAIESCQRDISFWKHRCDVLEYALKSENSDSYTEHPIVYRGIRKDTGEWMESNYIYGTTAGRVYLSVKGTKVAMGYSGTQFEAFTLESIDKNPVFVEVEPDTLEWMVEK